MNARYYNSTTGKFTSQDPVFWGSQNLADPQSLNSYSYANNNPIRFSDPSGKCVGPFAVICIAGGIGAIGGIASQAYDDYLTGEFGNRSWKENLKTYSVSATEGAVVGVGVAAVGVAAAAYSLSTVATVALVSGTAGTLTAGTTLVGNSILKQRTDPSSLITNASIATITAGTLETLPKVPGRLPNFGTQAFYTGAHTQSIAAQTFFSNSMQSLGQTAVYATSQSSSALNNLLSAIQQTLNTLQNILTQLSATKQ